MHCCASIPLIRLTRHPFSRSECVVRDVGGCGPLLPRSAMPPCAKLSHLRLHRRRAHASAPGHRSDRFLRGALVDRPEGWLVPLCGPPNRAPRVGESEPKTVVPDPFKRALSAPMTPLRFAKSFRVKKFSRWTDHRRDRCCALGLPKSRAGSDRETSALPFGSCESSGGSGE